MKRGFTLIELLIVVAIIAILAAIAVPNFLEAQTRSKVSRVQTDQRSLATALESYAVDHAVYPEYGNPRDHLHPSGHGSVRFVPVRITTPIAYMTQIPVDVFPGDPEILGGSEPAPYYYMHNYGTVYLTKTQHPGHVVEHFESLMGEYRDVQWEIWSYGPDLDDDHGTVMYDPTNGTISSGDMPRFGP